MATAAQMVAKAASQIGVKESPSGSNKVKYAKWYGMNGQPWCDMFVSWCANEIGALDIVGKYAYCPSHVNYFKKKGWWLDREEKPQPGDIIFFSNGSRACHVGIVEKRNGASSVTTIEGNTSTTSNDNGGSVMRRTRTYGTVGSSWYILGFGRPQYSKSGEWKKNSKGWWWEYADGSYPKSEWEKINGKWYYFDSAGYMVTGWRKVSGKWYYMNSSGAMQTGWLKTGGKWYYLNSSGAMQTGWEKVNGKWYYLNSDGAMATGWKKVSGKWYYLHTTNGDMYHSTILKINGKWYAFNSSGAMIEDKLTINSSGAIQL